MIRIIGPREYSKDIRVPKIAFVKENSDSLLRALDYALL